MKNLKLALVIAFLFIPSIAFADGEEVIYTMFIQIVLLIIFPIILFIIKLKKRDKKILALVYVLITILLFTVLSFVPYRDNMFIINVSIVFVPIITLLVTYFLLKNRDRELAGR